MSAIERSAEFHSNHHPPEYVRVAQGSDTLSFLVAMKWMPLTLKPFTTAECPCPLRTPGQKRSDE